MRLLWRMLREITSSSSSSSVSRSSNVFQISLSLFDELILKINGTVKVKKINGVLHRVDRLVLIVGLRPI
ncbi:hypothetical protein Scep_030308 [Stephania cephalantha]|uniref:Uncharacterized protein n=1 Tax=Stephania cephalantha TaxID=152367 RepID=A0AAP0E3T9_9MAGN